MLFWVSVFIIFHTIAGGGRTGFAETLKIQRFPRDPHVAAAETEGCSVPLRNEFAVVRDVPDQHPCHGTGGVLDFRPPSDHEIPPFPFGENRFRGPGVDNIIPDQAVRQFPEQFFYIIMEPRKGFERCRGPVDCINFGAFQINDTDATVTLLNSEKAPDNINYQGGTAPSYTSQVKLAMADGTILSGEVTVSISPNVVSYAGVPCDSSTVAGTVSNAPLVDAPAVNGASSGQVAYGTAVTLDIPDGAAVYYTTDGTDPALDDNGQPTGTTIRYYAGQPIVITRTMTIRAVAVKYGESSEVISETFTVPDTGGDIPDIPDDPDDPDDEPDTPATPGGTTGGGSSGYAVSVPASSSIRGGSITVSPRRADKGDTVTITVKPNDGYELDKLTVTDSKGNELELTDKGSGKYTFAMPGSSVKIQVSFREIAAQAVNPFTDVSTGAYYYDAVLWAVANGVTNGTTATTFSPNVTVTRAQMVTFLWRSHGAPRATGSNPFADVSTDAWYYDAVLWAVANGVTVGTSATTFSPDAPVTRSQAVTFQWRAAGSPVIAGDSFDDVAADAYYAGAVAWAVAGGITNGTGGNQFSPDVVVTRAQAVTFLWRELA